MTLESEQYWIARFLVYRGLFLTYFIAFLVAWNQFLPLAGEDGLLPFTRLLEERSFLKVPSLLHFFPSDLAVKSMSGLGIFISLVGLSGIEWLGPVPVAFCLFLLWALYLSLMKAGRLFYGYGWESFLCETGFLAMFLGGANQKVPVLILFLFSWLLFRIMFGAGMIKIRGDQCWRDLTCMHYHYETQPMPNPISWFAHRLPGWFHKLEVLGNHITELVVPFLYFLPQPLAGIGGLATVGFQGWLMITGNFSWLNFLTLIVGVSLVPDSFFFGLAGGLEPASLASLHPVQTWLIYGYAGLVLVLSYWPARNLLSKNQLMNAGFDPFSLVNTYGAFGSITRPRYELVVQGKQEGEEKWKTYEFKGKPTDPKRMPRQWAPYHLRLDWQMWFAALRHQPRTWLIRMTQKLLKNDKNFTSLLAENPFENDEDGPDEVRILRYEYHYTDWNEWWEEGRWWRREFVREMMSTADKYEKRSPGSSF